MNFADEAIFCIGGIKYTKRMKYTLNQVSIFNIQTLKWTEGPKLNIARYNSSSCVLDDFIYTFFGKCKVLKDHVRVIEKVNARNVMDGVRS